MALILARAVAPASKLATIGWWSDTTLGADLGSSAGRPTRCIRRWTGFRRQDRHRKQLAARHLALR